MDALRSTIQAVSARLKRLTHTQKAKSMEKGHRVTSSGKALMRESELSQLKSSLSKLSLVNSENTEKVKLLESALRSQETSCL